MHPLTKNRDNFLCTGPFLMSNSGNESHGHARSYAFGFKYNYLFFEKLQPKTFCDIFFITRFSKNIFPKNNFEKSKISIFRKIILVEKKIIEKNSTKNDFSKNQFFLIFQKKIGKIFFENRVMKKMSQKVFGCNFSKNKHFI